MIAKNLIIKEFFLETCEHIWYFMGRLLKRHISLHTRQDSWQGVPLKAGSVRE